LRLLFGEPRAVNLWALAFISIYETFVSHYLQQL
jgi:hypothetical protein